jgi:group I intron endonuclease
MQYIYALTAETGEPFYVGKSNNVKRRRKRHIYDAKTQKVNCPVHNKIRKLLREHLAIDAILLEECEDHAVDQCEQKWIVELRARGHKLYNVAAGGEGGKGITPEIAAKISEANTGRVLSEETRRKISESNKGKKFSAEHKAKLSEARRKRVITDETRKKASKTSTGKINIRQYTLVDTEGNVHRTTHGLSEFCKRHDLSAPNFMKVLSGKRPHHKGWRIQRGIDT